MNNFGNLGGLVRADEYWGPVRAIIYGVPGVGKSTLGAGFKNPIMLRSEDGAGSIDIPTFPGLVTCMWDTITAIQTLINEPHQFKTLVIDSLDWIEPIVWREVCNQGNKTNIEDFGYGKGYAKADQYWLDIKGWLEELQRVRGMYVVFIAHAEIKTAPGIMVDPFDRYQVKLHKRASALWTEWASLILFCMNKVVIHTTENGFSDQKRGAGSGERVLYTEDRGGCLAKNRDKLLPEIHIGRDLTYSAFHNELHAKTNGQYELPQHLIKG